MIKEAANLIELDTKVEHLPNQTKDTTDAAAGAYLNAISSEEVTHLSVPQNSPVILGPSPNSNASPEDPFGFFTRLPPRPRRVFRV